MFLRILTVLAASTAGLGAGSLLYYSLFEDSMIYRGTRTSVSVGNIWGGASIIWFLIVVYMLHLNEISALIVSVVGMAITKLLWDFGDGLRYAGRIYEALTILTTDSDRTVSFVKRAASYRQLQDLRSVAQTIFAPDSRPMQQLDEIIDQNAPTDLLG